MSHDHVSGGHDHGPAQSESQAPHDPPRTSADEPRTGEGDTPLTYAGAGVDVDAGSEAVRLLRERVTTVRHPFVLSGIGGFGGAMCMPPIKDGVLVAGCDGVGTKVMLARSAGVYDTIGIDLVAMSANDVSTCGAVPFFFLDYLVVGKPVPERVAEIVAGVDEGCRRAEQARRLVPQHHDADLGRLEHADDLVHHRLEQVCQLQVGGQRLGDLG